MPRVGRQFTEEVRRVRSTGKTVAWILVCATCTGLLLGLLVLRRPARGRGCNVLLITLDTTRADRLGCYGFDKAATPALDGLAARGTLFEHAFTCAPLTLPAHVTMFTGLYPPEHGLRLNDGRDALGKSVPLVHEILAESGYRTGAFIAAAVLESPYGLSRGFEHYDDTGLYPTTTVARRQMILTDNPEHMPYKAGDRVVDSALEWLQRVAEAVGELLAQVSRTHQIICITHLPQISIFGNNHLLVHKEIKGGETFTRIVKLDDESRKMEIARMLGGKEITDATMEHAAEFLRKGQHKG